jgi:hypothetical protein
MKVGRLAVGALLTLTMACAPHGPVIDTGPKPVGVGGTIAGTVRAAGGTSLTGRKVTVIDVATGAKLETSTAANGGYTIKVPAGTYRIEVELRDGETLDTRPGETQVNVGDVDADRNFVIAVKRP